MNRDLEIEHLLIFILRWVNSNRALISANGFTIRSHPIVVFADCPKILARPDFIKALMDFLPKFLLFAPKILAIDFSMRKPERTMVWMIVLLVRGCFHRPVAGHFNTARTIDGIEVRPRHVLVEIFGEQAAVYFDPQPVLFIFDLHADAGGCNRSFGSAQQREWDHGER